jgi:hypothetical protein
MTESVGDQSNQHASDTGRDQRQQTEQTCHGGRDRPLAQERGHDRGIQHDVEAVERPSERGCKQTAARGRGSVAEPRQQTR